MHYPFRLIGLLVIVLLPVFKANAQNSGEGLIRGTVINPQGEPVVGANVFVKKVKTGVATDVEGRFEISLKPGTYDLRISYVAYNTTTVKGVTVEPGDVNVLGNVQLSSDSNALKGVVISADRIKNSERAMLSLKQQSVQMIDGISAEKFRETGDGNAASAMKRVTGVSVQEGKYVFVRGLGGRYTKTTLNGVSVPSLDPNRNSLQMDIFPTTVLSNMVVSKTFTADQPANFSGGLVDIETRAFPAEKTFSISGGIGYNPSMHFQDNFLTYNGGNLDFLGMDDGTREIPTQGVDRVPFQTQALGGGEEAEQFVDILNDFSPQMGVQRSQSFMDYDLSVSGGNQKPLGEVIGPFSGSDMKLGYNFAVVYKNGRSYYDNAEFNAYGKPDNNSILKLELRESQQGAYTKESVLTGGLGGLALKSEKSKYRFNVLRLQNGVKKTGLYKYRGKDQGSVFDAIQHNLEYSERTLNNFLLSGSHYLSEGDWELDWRLSPTFSSVDDPDVRFSRVRVDTLNQGQKVDYSVGSESGIPQRIWRNLDEVNYNGQFDAKYNTKIFGRKGFIKTGVSYLYKQRDYNIKAFNINPQQDVEINGTNPDQILADSNLWSLENTGGTIYSPNHINNSGKRANRNAYSANVHKPAAYVSSQFKPLPELNIIAGVRSEYYLQRYSDIEADNRRVLDDLDFFPSLNMTYALSSSQNLRFSASQTIARPSLKEASAVTIFDPISGRFFNGGLNDIKEWEGNLTATRVQNFDLRWEWFQQKGQMLSVSAFYKTFDNPIEIVQLVEAKNNLQPRNVGDGQLAGIEVEVRQKLTTIYSGLKGFSFNGNFTLTESRIDISSNELRSRERTAREGQNVDDTRPMTRQAPYIVNGGLIYETPNGSFQASTYYNVKGRTLYLVGSGDQPDVYQEPFHNLKFNASYNFGAEDMFSLSFEATNLLNDDREKFFDAFQAQDRIFSRISPGRTFSLGFGVNF